MCAGDHASFLYRPAILQQVIATHLPSWIAARQAEKRPVPHVVQRELLQVVRCGDPAFGHATLGCPACGFTQSIPFACKCRSCCPYCIVRRMRIRAEHLVHRVIGDVPVRHWVECLPPQLRGNLVCDPSLLTGVLGCFVEAIFHHLRWKAKALLSLKSVSMAHPAAVPVIHFASANLVANAHFHCTVPDGVYVQTIADGPVVFRQLPAPTVDEIADVASRACRRTVELLTRRGFWHSTGRQVRDDEFEGRLTFGVPRTVRFFGAVADALDDDPAPRDGAYPFDVYAGHAVAAGDREGLGKLLEYVLAPPITNQQVTVNGAGHVVLRMKRPRRNGDTTVELPPHEFLDRLAGLIPRRRSKTIRLAGAYAPNARVRQGATPRRPSRYRGGSLEDSAESATVSDRKAKHYLHARAYPADFRTCPRCGDRLQLVTISSKNVSYRNRGWMKPDTPAGDRAA